MQSLSAIAEWTAAGIGNKLNYNQWALRQSSHLADG